VQINVGKKKLFHHLGQGGYKMVMQTWQKREDDLIAKEIIPTTFDWPLRAMKIFYTHGHTLSMEDGLFISTYSLVQEYNRLKEALHRKWQGSFKHVKEKDELTYALGNMEHHICV
jgi:hypothetical protein